jgi:putative FmdB family regulatory protein
MPLYEYRCRSCARQFTFLYGVVANNTEPRCPHCGGVELTKLISRVRRLRSDDERLERLADPTRLGDLDDPRHLHRFARTLGRELSAETGTDLSDEFDQLLDEEERGESAAEADEAIY